MRIRNQNGSKNGMLKLCKVLDSRDESASNCNDFIF